MNIFDRPKFWIDMWMRTTKFMAINIVEFPFEGKTHMMEISMTMEDSNAMLDFKVEDIFHFMAVYPTRREGMNLHVNNSEFIRKQLIVPGDHDINDLEHIVSLVVMAQETV